MAAKNSANEQFQNEIDDVSASVQALCELLAAAQNAKVSAACVHAILKPMARRLDVVASTAADARLALKTS